MISTLALLTAAAAVQQPSCDALKSLSLPTVTITAAQFVPAGAQQTPPGRGGQGAPLPAHCKVAATLRPSADSHIEMELWMPAENWNGKFLAVGNGGNGGSIETNDIADGLRRGYATASNDMGHKSLTVSFALGHPEKLVDFGYRSMHEMAVQSKAIIQAFYKRGPQASYYHGCSQGGRQGMMEAQRYPDDFDGIIAGAPTYNAVHFNISQIARLVGMVKEPSRILPPGKVAVLANAVVAACDEKDGVRDNIISEPRVCKFDPAVLVCKAGDAPDCLTPAQIENAKSAYLPVKTKKGELVYPGHSPGFESGWTGWRMPTPGQALNPLIGSLPRYVGRQDPNWDLMSLDLETDLALALRNGGFIEAGDPDLAEFKARGGKLLLYHGWADPGPAPENTIQYHEAVNEKLGGKQDHWMRLFLMPGVGHCGGGVGPDQADFLGAMERWREAGIVPDHIVATRSAGRGGQMKMTRPLCPFPQVARYTGSGSTNGARNFRCVQP